MTSRGVAGIQQTHCSRCGSPRRSTALCSQALPKINFLVRVRLGCWRGLAEGVRLQGSWGAGGTASQTDKNNSLHHHHRHQSPSSCLLLVSPMQSGLARSDCRLGRTSLLMSEASVGLSTSPATSVSTGTSESCIGYIGHNSVRRPSES